MKISVIMHPGSKKWPLLTEEVDMRWHKIYHVRVREKPVDGDANKALVSFLADYFSFAKSSVTIVSGHTSRHKTISLPL